MTRVKWLSEKARPISFKWKLTMIFSIILLLTTVLIGVSFYKISLDRILLVSKDMAYELVKKNTEIFNKHLLNVKENSAQLITDTALNEYLGNEEQYISQNILGLDRKITQILARYFSSGDVYSVQLITESFVYGNNTNLLTPQLFEKSSTYDNAMKKNGALYWSPVYDFTKMYGLWEYESAPVSNRWIFSAARLISGNYMSIAEKANAADSSSEWQAVLLINFTADFISGIFDASMPVQGASTYIFSSSGEPVYSSTGSPPDIIGSEEWFNGMIAQGSGGEIIRIGGKDAVVCFDTSGVTGWFTAVVIPAEELMVQTRRFILVAVIISIIAVMGIGFLLSVIISSLIARPIDRMVNMMHSIGDGDFNTELPVESHDEFGYLSDKFNSMNSRISRLIEDNYLSKLRENELEIMALNLQMNPHFLYNTLTVINYEALDSNQSRISEMIMNLCDMLSYTFRSKAETSVFKEDFEWLQNYISIMLYRFEDKFKILYDIDEHLMDIEVPKLFLQPFIENCIIHGFKYIDSGGVIIITGRILEQNCIFTVEDNGVGIDANIMPQGDENPNDAIGISNVNKRIRLLYGPEYGIESVQTMDKGTKFQIKLPVKRIAEST